MNPRDSFYDEDDRARRADGDVWAARGRAFLRWLKARPAESWLFFVAGLIVAGVLL
jgi:hypothetical protein